MKFDSPAPPNSAGYLKHNDFLLCYFVMSTTLFIFLSNFLPKHKENLEIKWSSIFRLHLIPRVIWSTMISLSHTSVFQIVPLSDQPLNKL